MALTPVSDAGGALLIGWVEAEVADEEVGLGRGEVLLVLGVRLRHLRFGKPKITAESATGYAVADAEIFFGDECVGCLHKVIYNFVIYNLRF